MPLPLDLHDEEAQRLGRFAVELAFKNEELDETSPYFCPPARRYPSLLQHSAGIAKAYYARALKLLEIGAAAERLSARYLRISQESLNRLMGPLPTEYPNRECRDQVRLLWTMGVDQLISRAVAVMGARRQVTKKTYVADRRLELIAHILEIHPRAVISELSSDYDWAVAYPNAAIDEVSLAVGVALGRWDAGYLVDDKVPLPIDNLFCRYPETPRVLLAVQELVTADSASDYHPVPVAGRSVIVDDLGHQDDVIACIQKVLRVIWKDADDTVYREISQNLSGKGDDLRSWFRKNFFAEHVKRYSRSRRKAPVYWELATPSHSYAVWLYYHRFTRDTLYKLLNDYVNPKLTHEEQRLARFRVEVSRNPTRARTKEAEAQGAFVTELATFREEIARIAPLWNPDLNDGVIINFAPLWRLVPQHQAWQKECMECWDSLVAGQYDWAHLAMHLWPERVVPKCRDDRSLAIAHGLEDLLWVEDDGRRRPLGEPDDEIEDQKKRQRLTKHDQLRSALAALAQGANAKPTAAELWKKLEAGDLDDTEAALLLWSSRVVEKCVMDPRLADKLHVTIPQRKTETAVAKLLKCYEADGCGHLAEAVGRTLGGCNTAYPAVWKSLETGDFDDQPLALALWPDRVVDKCVADRVLAEKQGLTQFFWYDDPWSKAWRRRQSPDVEVADEIAHRHKPAVKAALESLLSAPSPTGGKKKRRKK